MYLEHSSSTNRMSWIYVYTGSELLVRAEELLKEYAKKEKAARGLIATLMQNIGIAVSDKKNDDAKREVERVARIHEECQVYVHEFNRNPDKEFKLSIGDVVFFKFPTK